MVLIGEFWVLIGEILLHCYLALLPCNNMNWKRNYNLAADVVFDINASIGICNYNTKNNIAEIVSYSPLVKMRITSFLFNIFNPLQRSFVQDLL